MVVDCLACGCGSCRRYRVALWLLSTIDEKRRGVKRILDWFENGDEVFVTRQQLERLRRRSLVSAGVVAVVGLSTVVVLFVNQFLAHSGMLRLLGTILTCLTVALTVVSVRASRDYRRAELIPWEGMASSEERRSTSSTRL
jgi:hypothetical protein